MNALLAWDPASAPPVLTLLTVTIAYAAYHYAASPHLWTPSLKRRLGDRAPVAAVLLQRVLGFVMLGVIPAVIAFLALPDQSRAWGLASGDLGLTAIIVASAGALFVGMNALLARGETFQRNYPQLRTAPWTWRLLAANAAAWALYLAAYEFFFRGFFLWSMIDAFGVWPAIFITTAVYVAVHLPKNAGEALGCIPMGVAFAWMSIVTGSVIAPILVHLLIASSAETFAVLYSPTFWPRGERRR